MLYKMGITPYYNLTGSTQIILRKLFKHTPRTPHQLEMYARGDEHGIGAEKLPPALCTVENILIISQGAST